MTNEERKAALEAIIYAADEPATIDQLAAALGDEKLAVQSSLDELVASYATDGRGIEIREVAGGFKLYTKPQHHDVVRRFIKSLRPPLRLTMPALETLAVISYKQPVTGPEISEIRGVNTSGVLKTLLDKRLITTAGRKEVIGRPILYRTSKEFLMRFGLSDLQELPSLNEFEALAREALGSDEGVAIAEPDDLPTDEVDEVLDIPESAHTSVSAEASNQSASNNMARDNESVETLHGDHMATDKNAASGKNDQNVNEEEEEVAAEVTATNEGMPAGESDADPKDPKEVQSPDAFDAEKEKAAKKFPSSASNSTPDSKHAAAGE
ncbi:MAG: SMC-Scp complex subunit ScpB [Acidobacteriota bacterium]|nr:SMC-Scp complex subunit ScpB [Acidobacteriota bacterium]